MRGSTVGAGAAEPRVVDRAAFLVEWAAFLVDCAAHIVDCAPFVVDRAAVPEVAGDLWRPAGSRGWNVTPNPVPWIE